MARLTKNQRRKKKLKKWKQRDNQRKVPTALRRCGPCVACCTTMGVPELEKQFNTTCKHAGTSCDIYNKRPQSCQAFECLWLQGHGRPEHRPDRLGITLDLTIKDGPLGRAGEVIVAREVQYGSSDNPIVSVFLTQLSKSLPVYLMCRDGRRAIWHHGRIQQAKRPENLLSPTLDRGLQADEEGPVAS